MIRSELVSLAPQTVQSPVCCGFPDAIMTYALVGVAVSAQRAIASGYGPHGFAENTD